MPTYEYECEKCSMRFELRKRFSDNGSTFCPQCGSEARLVFVPTPIIFKGSGFYVTDNKDSNEHHLKNVKADKGDNDKKQEAD